jgi:Tfp pilus assembly protein PilF
MKKLFFIAIILINLNGLTFAQNDSSEYPYEKIARLRTQIDELLNKGETKKALQLLDDFKDEEVRKKSDFYLIKADVFLKDEDFEKANDYFQTAFDFEMLDFFTQYNLCRNAFSGIVQNIYLSCDFAIESYKKLSKINIKRQQEFEKSAAVQYLFPFNLKRSEELTPMFGDILIYRASAYLDTKNYDKAVEFLSIALKRNYSTPMIYRLRAKAYRGLGKITEAEADEEKLK